MTLSQLIAHLETCDPAHVCVEGFHDPHSYRGDYSALAFEPMSFVFVGDMLACARSAVGQVYQGWKGGLWQMDGDSQVYLARFGELGETMSVGSLERMLGMWTMESEWVDDWRGVLRIVPWAGFVWIETIEDGDVKLHRPTPSRAREIAAALVAAADEVDARAKREGEG